MKFQSFRYAGNIAKPFRTENACSSVYRFRSGKGIMVKRLLPSSCRNDSILHPMFNMDRRSSCSSRSDRPVYVKPKKTIHRT